MSLCAKARMRALRPFFTPRLGRARKKRGRSFTCSLRAAVAPEEVRTPTERSPATGKTWSTNGVVPVECSKVPLPSRSQEKAVPGAGPATVSRAAPRRGTLAGALIVGGPVTTAVPTDSTAALGFGSSIVTRTL